MRWPQSTSEPEATLGLGSKSENQRKNKGLKSRILIFMSVFSLFLIFFKDKLFASYPGHGHRILAGSWGKKIAIQQHSD